MTKRLAFVLAATLLLGACAARTRAHPRHGGNPERRDDRQDRRVEATTGWDKLGERWVTGGADRDAIPVGRGDGRFRVIKLKAEHSAIELYDIVVVFGDGTTFAPGTREVLAQGAWTRTIDLPGGNRAIRRIELRYGNLPGGGRAQLEVWGH